MKSFNEYITEQISGRPFGEVWPDISTHREKYLKSLKGHEDDYDDYLYFIAWVRDFDATFQNLMDGDEHISDQVLEFMFKFYSAGGLYEYITPKGHSGLGGRPVQSDTIDFKNIVRPSHQRIITVPTTIWTKPWQENK